MKKLLIIVCTIWASTCFAQDRNESLPCADTWHAIEYAEDWSSVVTVYNATYQLGSDSTINGTSYRKLIKNGQTCVGALRQSEDGMKVYYYDWAAEAHFPRTPREYLLYDFSANVGDTVNAYFDRDDIRIYIDWMGEPVSVGWIVVGKDTIDGRIHMAVERYYADSDSSIVMYDHDKYAFKTYWIQGVGTPNVLWPTRYGTKSFSILYTLCAMHGDEILYSYNLESLKIENNCTEWHFTALDDIQADDSKVRKFLRDGQLLIQTPLGTFNATGQQIE